MSGRPLAAIGLLRIAPWNTKMLQESAPAGIAIPQHTRRGTPRAASFCPTAKLRTPATIGNRSSITCTCQTPRSSAAGVRPDVLASSCSSAASALRQGSLVAFVVAVQCSTSAATAAALSPGIACRVIENGISPNSRETGCESSSQAGCIVAGTALAPDCRGAACHHSSTCRPSVSEATTTMPMAIRSVVRLVIRRATSANPITGFTGCPCVVASRSGVNRAKRFLSVSRFPRPWGLSSVSG